jgi:hypothetical protein
MSDIEKGHHGGAGHALLAPSHPTGVANPASLCVFPFFLQQKLTSELAYSGLFSFASTTFMLSFYNVSVRGIHHPNVVVGMALFTGGLAQLLAGMWEFPRGNVFGATGQYPVPSRSLQLAHRRRSPMCSPITE